MATVNRLLQEQADLEASTRDRLIEGDPTLAAAVRCGFAVAQVAATQTILDLSVKGIIPEGRGGRIMAELKDAIEASRDRVAPVQ